jgi:uncharacterized repeat protein (TIGR01451 family)
LSSRRRLPALVLALGVAALTAQPALAAGSRDLWPNGAGGSRANSEWRTNSYGGGLILRRTLVKAFMNAGDVLLVGSSAIGKGSSDILVWNPGLVFGAIGAEDVSAAPSFSCNTQRVGAQGQITSRAEELAGPDTIPAGGVPGGYIPCHYTAPSAGIYDIAFVGPAGLASAADGTVAADVALTDPNDFSAAQGTSIAAWDATVRSGLASPADITGRVFSYYLALFTAGNGLPVFPTVYPITRDGYRYQVDLRGMDPNGWLVYGNQLGFFDSDGSTPLYHDAVAENSGSPGQLTSIQGGVTFQRPSFPLFFEPPSAAAIAGLGIPATPTAPIMSALSFVGNLGGNTSLVNNGGTFHYVSNVPGVYNIVISIDGINFDPTSPTNRSLRGVALSSGAHTVAWDGRDNSGNFFPVGSYQVHASFHGGEYHFPMIDVENDTQGGPSITLLNPPSGTCPALTGGCTTGFYDDRAYRTLSGVVVDSGNTVGNPLCGNNPPATSFADPINGFDTTSNQRAFGAASGGNANVPCDPTGSFGDTKGLDTWTYYPSNTVLAPLNIVASAADIAINKTVTNATPAVGNNVTFTVTAHNNGPNPTTALQVTDLLPAGLTFVSATQSNGTYDSGTGVWNIGVLASGATATLLITAKVNGTTRVVNTATRTSSSPADPVAGNDSRSVAVTGSTVPGLPNNGAPPVGSLLPDAVGLVIVLILFGIPGVRRRPQS